MANQLTIEDQIEKDTLGESLTLQHNQTECIKAALESEKLFRLYSYRIIDHKVFVDAYVELMQATLQNIK